MADSGEERSNLVKRDGRVMRERRDVERLDFLLVSPVLPFSLVLFVGYAVVRFQNCE